MSSISAQINFIVQSSGRVEIGSTLTRHEQVQAAREAGYTRPQDVLSRHTSITTSATYAKYKAEWVKFGQWQRQHPEVCGNHPQIKLMTAEQVSTYLQDLSVSAKSYETFGMACKALSKLDGMIADATMGKFVPNVAKTIAEWREIGKETLPGGREHAPRAFQNPQAVLSGLRDERHELAAEIQLRTGLRAGDVCKMTLNPDGQSFFVNSKCGNRFPSYQLPADLTDRVKALATQYGRVLADGSVRINLVSSYKSYLRDLSQSCRACGETYSGSHSLRYNFARALFLELRSQGMDIDHAKAKVSEALFHHRLDITERYLAGLV